MLLAANSTSKNEVTTNQTKSSTSVPIINSKNTVPAINTSQQANQSKINVVASFFPICEFVKEVQLT